MQTKEYWQMNPSEVITAMNSSLNGLTEREARIRLEKYGPNEFPLIKKKEAAEIFVSQFKSPFVLILIAASFISFFLGEQTDAVIIIVILFLTSIMGFIQEYRGENALSQLRKLVTFKTKVSRDGRETEVDSKELVPGDRIFLEIGDVVPADARIISENNFTCDESALTGENEPSPKSINPILNQQPLIHEIKNTVFMGTHVASGTATAVVLATADRTQLGKTASFLKTSETASEFEKDLSSFGNLLVYLIIAMTIGIFLINALLGKPLFETLLFSLAIAVGITPEVLPIIITLGLSHGAIELSKKKVIVKKLASIENLGNIDVLCSDKTGTLTENNLTLNDYFDAEGKKNKSLLIYSVLCNSAVKIRRGYVGNSIDVAIMRYCEEEYAAQAEKYIKLDQIEFDFERKRMSVIVKDEKGGAELICKGSFDAIISNCSHVLLGDSKKAIKPEIKYLEERFKYLSAEGYRVIAVASKKIKEKKNYSKKDEEEMTFLGFVSFYDPPRKDSSKYIKELYNLGVGIKIITGDSPEVTRELCRIVDFGIAEGKVIEGSELLKMGRKEFLNTVEKYNVFVRVSPEAKLAIVKGIQENGHVVGFMGDGINDADALKQADCGITVDSAVDIARESANIILTHKSLFVIIDGIKEGRKTFGNMIKYILNTISANFGNMFTLAISSMFLPFIPLLSIQILLTNFLSDGPLLMVSTDKVDEEYINKPKKWSTKAISRFMIYFGLISSAFDIITIIFLMFILHAQIDLFRTAWFVESVLSEILVTFSIRTRKPFWKSYPSKWLLLSSLAVIIITIGLIYSPLALYFSFVQMPLWVLGTILLILASYFTIVEIAKWIFYKKVTE